MAVLTHLELVDVVSVCFCAGVSSPSSFTLKTNTISTSVPNSYYPGNTHLHAQVHPSHTHWQWTYHLVLRAGPVVERLIRAQQWKRIKTSLSANPMTVRPDVWSENAQKHILTIKTGSAAQVAHRPVVVPTQTGDYWRYNHRAAGI